MSSKFLRASLAPWICLVIASQQLSCTPKVGEEPPPPQALGVKPSPCLDKAMESIGEFFRGTAKDADLSESWGCLSSAFAEFKKYVRGRESDRYNTQELATFIEDNFIERNPITARKRRISPELQVQMMKIKIILIGGSTEYLTRNELTSVINLLGDFRRLSLAINPSMKILTMNWKPEGPMNDAQMEEFEKANFAIQTFVKDFASLVKNNNPSYDLNDIPVLMKELEKFYDDNWGWLPKLEQYVPLLKKIKKAIAGGEEDFVAPAEWRIFMLLGGRAYVQYLRFHYFISDYTENLSGNRAAYIARTFEDIFSIFQDLVAEKPSGQVSRIETAEILEALSKAWQDFKTSDNFVFEIMKIKRVVLGGSIEFWSSKDFESARLKVSKLKDIITELLPYRHVYTFGWKPDSMTHEDAQVHFNNARLQLIRALKEFGSYLEDGYSSSDLINLLTELEKLYPPGEGKTPWVKTVNQYSCMANDLKRMIFDERKVGDKCAFVNGKAENWTIGKGQWDKFLDVIAQFYTTFLQFDYFVSGKSLNSGSQVQTVNWFGNDAINMVQQILSKRQKPVMTTEELTALALDLSQANVLPKELKPATVQALMSSIVNKFLNPPEDRLKGVIPVGINQRLLANLANEFNIWNRVDLFLMEIYERNKSPMTNQEVLKEITNGLEQHKDDPYLMTGLSEMKLVFETAIPMPLDPEGRVIISYGKESRFSSSAIKQFNLSRMIVRTLIRAFGLNLNRITTNEGVQKCEAELAFQDLKGAFVDLGMLDAGSNGFISSRFTEANIFLPHSDGKALMSFQEFHDLVTMIFSGFAIDNKLKLGLQDECKRQGNPLTRSSDLVELVCLRKVYYNNISANMAFASLPDYMNYFTNTSPAVWNASFFQNLKAAGYVPNNQQLVKIGDATLFPHIIQYTEMLFNKFDQNHDGKLSKPDAIKAFPTFKNLLKDLAKKQIDEGLIDENELEAVFTYIVKYAEIPGCDKSPMILCLFDGDVWKWLDWKKNYRNSDQTIYATRDHVAKILGLIADEVRKGPPTPPPNPQQCSAGK